MFSKSFINLIATSSIPPASSSSSESSSSFLVLPDGDTVIPGSVILAIAGL
jgi:hypothetical protein